MSIKPIDFQVVLPKTAEVSKIHSDEQNRTQAALQQQASKIQHKAQDSVRQVHSQDNSQQAKINQKQEKNQGKRRENRKNKKEGEPNRQGGPSELRTSTIDIKI